MRVRVCVVLFCLLGLPLLASCRGGEPPFILTPTSTRTLNPSTTSPPPLATDTPYPTDTPSPRPPTNTLSATLTQSWPQTLTPVPTITRTPTQTLTWTPSPTVTGTPFTATPTPTVTQSATPSPSATMSDQPLVWVSPPLQTAQPGGSSGQVEIRLSNFDDVYDMDLLLSYNKDLLTIIDANSSLAGIQVIPGTCPKPDLVLLNRVDTVNGTIEYQVTQLDPTLPCDDGIVVTVEFACITSGTSFILIDNTLVIDVNGLELAHDFEDGTIVCQP